MVDATTFRTSGSHFATVIGCVSEGGLGSLAVLDQLPSVAADDAKVDPKLVRLDSGHFATEDRLQDIVDGITASTTKPSSRQEGRQCAL